MMAIPYVLLLLETAVLLLLGIVLSEAYARMRRAEERMLVAQERLYAAWKDGYSIPAPPDPPPPPPEPLIQGLQDLISDWETPEAQQAQEKVIRKMLADGYTQSTILNMLTAPTEVA